ncbi:phage head-tail connector protein [Clostridium sp. 1001271B_151109_B4]|uniref:phage head-tail connector protein n=1 Tax=Clostridium sp. 1001271B_151109_B4 TaxID=2787148 RepID=UPI0018A97850|nr:phage head-tail connector protein [Clostridium sp. 1001271B_151109_B4]
MTQLEKLKIRTNEDDVILLNQILEDAEAEILDYCNRDILLPRMLGLQRELAVIYYNRLGSEGESSRSEGGVSISYSTDIPENIKRRLNSYRRLKAVRLANENKE